MDFPSGVKKRKCWKRCQTALEAEMLYMLNSKGRRHPRIQHSPDLAGSVEGGGGNWSSHPINSRSICQHRRRESHPSQVFFFFCKMDLVHKVRDILYTNTDQLPAICLFLCSVESIIRVLQRIWKQGLTSAAELKKKKEKKKRGENIELVCSEKLRTETAFSIVVAWAAVVWGWSLAS